MIYAGGRAIFSLHLDTPAAAILIAEHNMLS